MAVSVLVVDDSALMRNLISKMFDTDPEIEVAGKAMNGQFALNKIPMLQPDVIILDLEMPEINGIEFLKIRKERNIQIPVIILSSIAEKGAQVTMEAMSLGASDFILKPVGRDDIKNVQAQLVELVKAYGRKYQSEKKDSDENYTSHPTYRDNKYSRPATGIARPEAKPEIVVPKTAVPKTKQGTPSAIDVIAIGISTGGPNALRQVLPNILPNINVPILIVQHMPPGFTEEFAKSLNKICALEVKEADEGDVISGNRIFIAPGDHHIKVSRRSLANIINLDDSSPVNGHKPSADVLYKSVAEIYGRNCLAVIMTGMGRDGATEIGQIYEAGGITIAQDQESAVVFGMPKVAIENGYIDEIVRLDNLADRINSLVMDINGRPARR